MNTNFNELPWHDATLKTININRSKPGIRDSIELFIAWPEDKNTVLIEFLDCYAFFATMNFGISAPETILMADCLYDCSELIAIRKKWLQVGVVLDNLKYYQITTNSTNSTIKIFARKHKIIHQEKY